MLKQWIWNIHNPLLHYWLLVINVLLLGVACLLVYWANRARRCHNICRYREIRIRLDEKLFTALIKGEEITITGPDSEHLRVPVKVKMILADMGYERMLRIIGQLLGLWVS